MPNGKYICKNSSHMCTHTYVGMEKRKVFNDFCKEKPSSCENGIQLADWLAGA